MSGPEFVTFHSDRPVDDAGAHPNANLGAGEYMRMIDMLFRSVRLFHRHARCTLLTDAATRVNGVRGRWRRSVHEVDYRRLMLSRTRAQHDYVSAHDFRCPLALIDSDILVNGSLGSLCDQDFDVALTVRPSKRMPINGGLIILNNRRPDRSRAFVRRLLEIYETRFTDDAQWYGDQLALVACLDRPVRELSEAAPVTVGDVRVLLLPCETFNFSSDADPRAIERPLPDKRILHFKGPRKPLMPLYWAAHLRPREFAFPFRWYPRAIGARAIRDAIARQAVALTAPQ